MRLKLLEKKKSFTVYSGNSIFQAILQKIIESSHYVYNKNESKLFGSQKSILKQCENTGKEFSRYEVE